MSSTSEAFSLLLVSLYGGRGSAMQVRYTGVQVPHGQIWWAVDSSGTRRLLVPLPPDYAMDERVGESLEVRALENAGAPLNGRYLDLACREERLKEVFACLCDDVLARLRERPADPAASVLLALDEWTKLLAAAPPVSEEVARGIFGELTLLRRLAERNPIYALDAWTGPTGHVHDFAAAGSGDIEVKTSEKEAMEIIVSSLYQVDPRSASKLVLIRLRVVSTPQGQSIGELVDELESAGCIRSALVKRLAQAGVQLGVDSDEHRFQVIDQDERAWLVSEDFPGIRASELSEDRRDAISGLRYTLSLVRAPGLMNHEQFDHYLDEMMTA